MTSSEDAHCHQFAPGRGEGNSVLHLNYLPTDFLRKLVTHTQHLRSMFAGCRQRGNRGGKRRRHLKSAGKRKELEARGYQPDRMTQLWNWEEKEDKNTKEGWIPKIQKAQITSTTDHENYIKIQITQHPLGFKKILQKLNPPLPSKPTQCCGDAESTRTPGSNWRSPSTYSQGVFHLSATNN